MNYYLFVNKNKKGIDFATAILEAFSVKIEIVGMENIPKTGRYILVANHPLGGLDGMALISEIGKLRSDIIFPVNEFLLALPNFSDIFIPINKSAFTRSHQEEIENAFISDNLILYFPAGLCSRKQNKEIKDPEWKKTFITKAIESKRDIIPVFINGENSKFFYNFANLRKRLGIKINIEQAFLVNEMFKQKDKTIKLIVGQPIPYSTLDKQYSEKEWAARIKEHVYLLPKQQG